MASDGEYVRWINCKEPGQLMFVTTTVLGYTPAFRTEGAKARLLALLFEACRLHGAILHAYCLMDHHLHLVLRAPATMTMSKFMQSFKRHSARSMLRDAHPWILRRLRETGRDGRSFWMRSFRGIPIRKDRVFWGCVKYTHLNPVRSGICENPLDYPWSSARLFEECRWDEDGGLLPWTS